MALGARRPVPGLVHHSDRGVQYACADYAARLAAHGLQPSMSRVANPYDNAQAESFMKTLKHEEVDGRAYRDLRHARREIGDFIDEVYFIKPDCMRRVSNRGRVRHHRGKNESNWPRIDQIVRMRPVRPARP